MTKLATKYHPPYSSFNTIDDIVVDFQGFDSIVGETLFTKLNANIVIYNNPNLTFNGYSNGILSYIINGDVDFVIFSLFPKEIIPRIAMSNPTRSTGISVVSRRKGLLSPVEKLMAFIPLHICFLFFITSVMIFFILKYILMDPYSTNATDLFRVYLSLPVPKLPVTNKGRLIFAAALIIFLIVNAVIQGNLAKILILQKEIRNIETIKDINELGYTVRSDDYMLGLMESCGVKNTKFISEQIGCSYLALNEAYVDDDSSLRVSSPQEYCHIPKKPLILMYQVYYSRRKWPLYAKANLLLLMMFEGGLFEYWFDQITSQFAREPETIKYRPLMFDDLMFIFVLWLAGIIFAIIIFLLEFLAIKGQRYQSTNIIHGRLIMPYIIPLRPGGNIAQRTRVRFNARAGLTV